MNEKSQSPEEVKSFVAYATIDQLNNEATTRANQDGLLSTAINLLTTDYQNFKSTTNTTLNNKQNKTDNGLNTTDKTVVGAINELFKMVQEFQNQDVINVDFEGQAAIVIKK